MLITPLGLCPSALRGNTDKDLDLLMIPYKWHTAYPSTKLSLTLKLLDPIMTKEEFKHYLQSWYWTLNEMIVSGYNSIVAAQF